MSDQPSSRDDIKAILSQIPHRFPFLLVDRVLEFVPGEKLVALKNVSMNEPFFPGHFPGEPVMPGVLIVEALAQAGLLLGLRSSGPQEKGTLVYFAGIDKARFKRQVVPGDQLLLKVTWGRANRRLWRFHGEAWVDDKLACAADIMAAPVQTDGPANE